MDAINGMIAWWQQQTCEGGAERAYTLKIRQGCDGGGKGSLVQKELSATLATHQDQTLVQNTTAYSESRAAGFDAWNSGGIGYSEKCSPTMTGAAGTAVVQKGKTHET